MLSGNWGEHGSRGWWEVPVLRIRLSYEAVKKAGRNAVTMVAK